MFNAEKRREQKEKEAGQKFIEAQSDLFDLSMQQAEAAQNNILRAQARMLEIEEKQQGRKLTEKQNKQNSLITHAKNAIIRGSIFVDWDKNRKARRQDRYDTARTNETHEINALEGRVTSLKTSREGIRAAEQEVHNQRALLLSNRARLLEGSRALLAA